MSCFKKFSLFFIIFFICVFNTSTLAISNTNFIGKWQSIVDGTKGESSIFYRLEFKENGHITIIKQSGNENLTEEKSWIRVDDSIKIFSTKECLITDFNDIALKIEDSKTLIYKNSNYESVFKPYNFNYSLSHWILIPICLMILNELFRKSKVMSVLFFIVFPILLIHFWNNHGVIYWFKWIKLYYAILSCIWLIIIKNTKLKYYRFSKLIIVLFPAITILEATLQSFSMSGVPNVFNGIAGIFSILTLFYGWEEIFFDNSSKRDLIGPKMTTHWIVGYAIWNFTFVYINFPGSASAQLMVILSFTLPALFIKKGTWFQAHAFTLTTWFIYYFTFPIFVESIAIMLPRNTFIIFLLAILSISINIIYALSFALRVHKPSLGTLK